MSKSLTIAGLIFTAAAFVGVAGVSSHVLRDARPQVATASWSLVNTVRTGERADTYVMDHGLTIEDCGREALQVRSWIADENGNLPATLSCELEG